MFLSFSKIVKAEVFFWGFTLSEVIVKIIGATFSIKALSASHTDLAIEGLCSVLFAEPYYIENYSMERMFS